MKQVHDLSQLSWQVAGYTPHEWRLEKSLEIGASPRAETPAVSAPVPGSVQKALRQAGLLPDWNLGLNSRLCEWVENRHWIYEVALPDEWFGEKLTYRLKCLGLDYCGCIRLNQHEIYSFRNSQVPHTVDLTPHLASTGNILQIIFECPPRWLGQFGYTSQMTDWKPRFNYFWDWTSRLVQIGIWDDILLETSDGVEIENLKISSGFDPDRETGHLEISGSLRGLDDTKINVTLERGTTLLRTETIALSDFSKNGIRWQDLNVRPWWPNALGDQPLYKLLVQLTDRQGTILDQEEYRIGFRHIDWQKCEGAPDAADPWICVANGRRFFLQGVNWTPIRPNFADVPVEEYRKRLKIYRDLGFNLIRVWGGAFLEKKCFYDLCDELGLLVWQEFPLSSSGLDNYPPDDEESIAELSGIARSFIARRRHHTCLILWCGGNELRAEKIGDTPIGLEHPLMRIFHDIAKEMDPSRRFLPSTPSGPRFNGNREEFGKGVHWAVNGPWKANGKLENEWIPYWNEDDALLRSETGAPGPCSADLIRSYRGNCPEMPVSLENPLWRRAPWWVESDQFMCETGRVPQTLEEYVDWGQARQAQALTIAAKSCKDRFPRCGGFLIWMGHDSFPCPSNTSILDFEGNPKPAALALAKVFSNTSAD